MYHLSHIVTEIPANQYIQDYRDAGKFIVFCRQCERYGNCWSCPPFDLDADAYLAGYAKAYLIGTKIIFDEKSSRDVNNAHNNKELMHSVVVEVRRKSDEQLLLLEQAYPDSKVFFAGACIRCALGNCMRIAGKPCVNPEKVRPSLESLGFDIGKTSSELLQIELKWSKDGSLPEYLVLVSGFFTNNLPCDSTQLYAGFSNLTAL